MNQQEILDYNKRCALFLGAYFCNDDLNTYPNGYWMTNDIEIDLPYNLEDMEFHFDWNWIMEVIEAIQKIIIKDGDEFCIEFYKGLPDKPKTFVSITENIQSENNNPKEAVVEAINQFLIWYEQNKQL